MTVFVELDLEGAVRSIEFARPADGADEITLDGHDVFAVPADELVVRLREATPVAEEEGGRTAILRGWTVALWRPTLPEGPDDEDGRWFESALVGVDAYFDDDGSPANG